MPLLRSTPLGNGAECCDFHFRYSQAITSIQTDIHLGFKRLVQQPGCKLLRQPLCTKQLLLRHSMQGQLVEYLVDGILFLCAFPGHLLYLIPYSSISHLHKLSYRPKSGRSPFFLLFVPIQFWNRGFQVAKQSGNESFFHDKTVLGSGPGLK